MLHLRAILQILVAIFILSYAKIEAKRSLSEVEDLELERQLNLLNKPAIKTIKGRHGEIYDCVDFYKQPAFDHPLLKNHDFHPEMKPTLPNLQGDDTPSNINRPFNIELEGGGCPTGTVLIRRITKDDLIRQIHLSQVRDTNNSPDGYKVQYFIWNQVYGLSRRPPGFATVQIPDNPVNKLAGAGAILSLHNPQISGGFIKVQNGIDNIQVRWIVNPDLYGDNRTRSYTYLKTGKSACFNTRCPGFVHVNSAIPLDGELLSSTYGGPIYDIPMYIARDKSNGNWWFRIGSNYTAIGFWPATIFTKLNGFATSVEYGGVAHYARGDPDAPSMGGGYFPVGDLKKDGYCRNSIYINDKNQMKSLDDIPVKLYNSPWYRVTDYPKYGAGYGNIVLYGGPLHGNIVDSQ
ncbi:hypothetical protein P3L10_000388 [Capsicum annuum]